MVIFPISAACARKPKQALQRMAQPPSSPGADRHNYIATPYFPVIMQGKGINVPTENDRPS